MLFHRLFLCCVLLTAGSSAEAATLTWPNLSGVGVCQASLQACIDGAAAGDTILIGNDDLLFPDGYTAIDEHLSINRSLTLAPHAGIDAVMMPGRTIAVTSALTGSHDVTVRGLILREGSVNVLHRSNAESIYRIERLRLRESDGSSDGCAINFNDVGTGRPQFIANDNIVESTRPPSVPPRNGLCAHGTGGAWQVDVFRNRIRSENTSMLRSLAITGHSDGPISIAANQISGHGFVSGISVYLAAGGGTSTLDVDNNVVSGQSLTSAAIGEFAIQLQVADATVRVRNNSVAYNSRGLIINDLVGNVSGVVANNLVAFNATSGLTIVGGSLVNRHNLVHGNGPNSFVPGPVTITADPRLAGPRDLRPSPWSPGRDNGNNADAPLFLGLGFDADGERRIAGSTVDIGAYEYNDDFAVTHVATPGNVVGNNSVIDTLMGLSSIERLLVSPHRVGGTPAERAQTIGVFQNASNRYFVFHQSPAVSMSPGRRFSVMAPLLGNSSFLHTTSLASIVGQYSRLDHAELNGRPSAIAFAMHNRTPDGIEGTDHDHRIGLEYSGGRWHLRNEDGADMAAARSFNVVVAPLGSPNAFVGKLASTAAALRLDHPLLDDNACAAPHVMRVDDPFDASTIVNNAPWLLEYRRGAAGAPGRWYVVAEGAGMPIFPGGAAFNVLVPGAQAGRCLDDRIFADGFSS